MNNENPKQTSGEFKIKLSFPLAPKNVKEPSEMIIKSKAKISENSSSKQSKPKDKEKEPSKLEEKKRKIKSKRGSENKKSNSDGLNFENRRITRRMSRLEKEQQQLKIVEIELKKLENDDSKNMITDKKIEKLSKGLNTDFIKSIMNENQEEVKSKIRPVNELNIEEIAGNSEQYLANMIQNSNTTKFPSKMKQESEMWAKPDRDVNKRRDHREYATNGNYMWTSKEVPQFRNEEKNQLMNRFQSGFGRMPMNNMQNQWQRNLEQERKQMMNYYPEQNYGSRIPMEISHQLEQERKYRYQMECERKIREQKLINQRAMQSKEVTEYGYHPRMKHIGPRMNLNKRSYNEYIKGVEDNQESRNIEIKFMKESERPEGQRSPFKHKSQSNPPEKIIAEYKKEDIMEDLRKSKKQQILEEFCKEISVNSEKLEEKKDNNINQIRSDSKVKVKTPPEPSSNVVDKEINMKIDVNIEMNKRKNQENYRKESDGIDIQVSPQVELEINGIDQTELVRQSGFGEQIPQKIDRIFDKSEFPSDRDLQRGGQEYSNWMRGQQENHNQYTYYYDYKQNMGEFLGFEVALENKNPETWSKRLAFILKKGGVDKNYWLNYYCSLNRKKSYLEYSDIIKGRLNCLSFSLKEYNNNFNHKIHRPIFNMGKAIYRWTRKDIERLEREIQASAYQREYYNYEYSNFNRNRSQYQNRERQYRLQNQNYYGYVHPRLNMNQQQRPYDYHSKKYFPYYEPQQIWRQQNIQEDPYNQNVMRRREEYFTQDNKRWENREEIDPNNLEIVTINNCIGGRGLEDERENAAMNNSQSKSLEKEETLKNEVKLNEPEEKISSKIEEEIQDNHVSQESAKPIRKNSKVRKRKIIKDQVSEKKKIIKNITETKPEKEEDKIREPIKDDKKAWVEYFSQINYSQLPTNSRSYKKISANFAFELKEVLEMQEKFNDQLFQKEEGNSTVDLKKLNKKSPFSKYYNCTEKSENFAKDYNPKVEDHDISSNQIRKIGILRKHIWTNYSIVTSVQDMLTFLDNQKDEKLLWELIAKKDSATKGFIQMIRSKR